jgi:phage host-nuclease inhibitor protein Gam
MYRNNPHKLNSTIDEFCKLYNDTPSVLEAYSIPVNLSANTVNRITDQIIFDPQNNGNYWVILLNNNEDSAWLVPNPLCNVNFAGLPSFSYAFDSNKEEDINLTIFRTLLEPVQVKALPTEPTTWKLNKRGAISFFTDEDAQEKNREIKKLSNEFLEELEQFVTESINMFGNTYADQIKSLKSEVTSLNDKIKNVERDLETNIAPLKSNVSSGDTSAVKKAINDISSFLNRQSPKNQEFNDYKQSSGKIIAKHNRILQDLMTAQQQQMQNIKILESSLCNLVNRCDYLPESALSRMNGETVPEEVLLSDLGFDNSEEKTLCEEYNEFENIPNSLQKRSYIVSVNNETFARLQDGDESNVVFRIEIKGDYLIVPGEEYHYLLPSKEKRMIHHRYNTIKAIYECNDYSEKYQGFCLDTPALVSEESIGCWKLVQKGILEFT